jgi:hypothetical protein
LDAEIRLPGLTGTLTFRTQLRKPLAAVDSAGGLANPYGQAHPANRQEWPPRHPAATNTRTWPISEQDKFTPDEWRTLQFAPFWMFSAIVGTYGHFDPREYRAFLQAVQLATTAPGQLTREVMGSVTADHERLTEEYAADERSIAVGLRRVATVLDKTSHGDARSFKDTLIASVGKGVARARGRFGTEVSEDDAKTLTLVAQLLDGEPALA